MKIKDLHTCDNFFKIIVPAHIIALYIYYHGFTKITDLLIWLFKNDWLDLIDQIEMQYLNPEKV